jgi:SAM-dependent methyltransferase
LAEFEAAFFSTSLGQMAAAFAGRRVRVISTALPVFLGVVIVVTLALLWRQKPLSTRHYLGGVPEAWKLRSSGAALPGHAFGAIHPCLPRGSLANTAPRSYLDVRKQFTWAWLDGGKAGIEIGALQQPFQVPPGSKVRYVDSWTLEELRRKYPELASAPLVVPDIIDKAETLATIADSSQDFVLASHVLEHMENAILAVRNMLRVLRVGGVLVLVVPMKCEIFDRHRIVTSWDHFLAEYNDETLVAENRREHYREWAWGTAANADAGAVNMAEVDTRAAELDKSGYSVHFHTWDHMTFFHFLHNLQDLTGFAFVVEEFVAHKYETLVVLSKE